jgi:hypothetical protein
MSARDRLLAPIIEREQAWHYEGGRRDLRFDLLRGFATLVMVADHIGGEGSLLYPITGGNRFFVSAAEAFVFISGIVMGIVYRRVTAEQGLGSALIKALGRAWSLYVLTLVLTLTFAAAGYLLDLWWAPDTSDGGVSGFVIDVVTLHRTIFLADIMLMFTFLVLGAGPVLLLLSQGKTLVALAASWLIWAAWQVAPESSALPWTVEGNTVFNIPAWQVLFVTAIVIGWHRDRVEAWVTHLARPLLLWSLAAACIAVLALYIAQLSNMDALRASETIYEFPFDKADVPLGRLLVFALLATFSFTFATAFWQPVKRVTGWLLLPLGTNALTAYSLHIYLVAATTWLTDKVIEDRWPDAVVSTTLQLAGIALVWTAVVLEPKAKLALKKHLGPLLPPARGAAGREGPALNR